MEPADFPAASGFPRHRQAATSAVSPPRPASEARRDTRRHLPPRRQRERRSPFADLFPFLRQPWPQRRDGRPGLRVNRGCKSTRPSVLDERKARSCYLPVEGQHERSPSEGRTPGVAVFANDQPGPEMESDVDPIAALPGPRRQNNPTGRIGLVLRTGRPGPPREPPSRHAHLDAERSRSVRLQRNSRMPAAWKFTRLLHLHFLAAEFQRGPRCFEAC